MVGCDYINHAVGRFKCPPFRMIWRRASFWTVRESPLADDLSRGVEKVENANFEFRSKFGCQYIEVAVNNGLFIQPCEVPTPQIKRNGGLKLKMKKTIAQNTVPLLAWIIALLVAASAAQVLVGCDGTEGISISESVLTQHNDNARTGAYLAETQLKPSNVRASTFGKLYSLPVDGPIAAQPLFVQMINGVARLYVATRKNKIYAFDVGASQPSTVWELELKGDRNQNAAHLPGVPKKCGQLRGPVGITSTPVIDPATSTMFVVFRTGENPSSAPAGNSQHWLAAVDISTGRVRANVKVIEPNFPPDMHLNRAGLLLLNGVIYIGFGAAVCDSGGNPDQKPDEKPTPHGWVFAYDMQLRFLAAFNTTPQTALGGVWQSGSGLAADKRGTVYTVTGNHGTAKYGKFDNSGDRCFLDDQAAARPPWGLCRFPEDPNKTEVGQSILKLRLQRTSTTNNFEVSKFRPGTWFRLDTGERFPRDPEAFYKGEDGMPRQVDDKGRLKHVSADTDLGSGGAVVLSNGLVIGGGKQGRVYVIDPNHMERAKSTFQFYHTWNPEISPCDYDKGQEYGPNIHGALVAWHPAAMNYSLIYGMPEKEYLKAFRIYDNGTVEKHPTHTTMDIGIRSPRGMPGAALSLSADGDREGILWASVPKQDSPDAQNTDGTIEGRLLAFDAQTLELLWEADDPVYFAKFVPPTIANGKVFRVAYQNQVVAYGLKPGSTGRLPRTEAFVNTRLVMALWRDSHHIDLFTSSRREGAGDVLSTNWEAVCPSPNPGAVVRRGWRGWFPVATLVEDDRPKLPRGFSVTVAGGQPVTAVKGDPVHADQVNVFVTNKAGHVMSNFWRPNKGWHAWFAISPSTGITVPGQPITALWSNTTHLDLFMVNKQGRVMSTFFQTNRWRPKGWVPIRPDSVKAAPSSPVAALWRDRDHLDLFITDEKGRVMWAFWEFDGGWREWRPISPEMFAQPGQPVTALRSNPPHLDLFIADKNRRVMTIFQERSTWRREGWFSIGRSRTKPGQTITALWSNKDHLDLFMTDDQGQVASTFWEFQGGWREWFPISPSTGKAAPGQPITALWSNRDHLDLFMTDKGGRVLSTYWEFEGGWREWFSIN